MLLEHPPKGMTYLAHKFRVAGIYKMYSCQDFQNHANTTTDTTMCLPGFKKTQQPKQLIFCITFYFWILCEIYTKYSNEHKQELQTQLL